jgi:ubiquinone/menaquinone biosynthesis C-methylase UbiE
MTNSIQFLNADLLNDQPKVKEIDHWLKVMNRPQGWHYDLDIIWILQELEKAGIKKGATILDAGAGMGVTQYVLAAKGYNVISLDFSHRTIPDLTKGIFDMQVESVQDLNYKHDYMGFVDYGTGTTEAPEQRDSLAVRGMKMINRGPVYLWGLVKNYFRMKRNKDYNIRERSNDHKDFGTIRLIRAAFHEIPLADMSVDALVSVSAIEHADKALMSQNIQEMKRVVKEGGLALITTSASDQRQDVFHEKTRGWCFSEESLKEMGLITGPIEFNYEEAEKNILNSHNWFSRIDPYYYNDPESEFFRKKIRQLPYLPVGIKIIK